jgi:hypothetical protein
MWSEYKMEKILQAMGGILCAVYPTSHARLYALRRLKIDLPRVHHKLRKKKLDEEDKIKLKKLLIDLERYIGHYGIGVYQIYYVNLWQKNVYEILSGD